MKPFNLERALAGDPVIGRLGQKVLQLAYFPDAKESSQLVVLFQENTKPWFCHQNGHYYANGVETHHDLFMAPKKAKGYLLLSKTRGAQWDSVGIYKIQAHAEAHISEYFEGVDTQIIEVEYEE